MNMNYNDWTDAGETFMQIGGVWYKIPVNDVNYTAERQIYQRRNTPFRRTTSVRNVSYSHKLRLTLPVKDSPYSKALIDSLERGYKTFSYSDDISILSGGVMLSKGKISSLSMKFTNRSLLSYDVELTPLIVGEAGGLESYVPDSGDYISADMLKFDGAPCTDISVNLTRSVETTMLERDCQFSRLLTGYWAGTISATTYNVITNTQAMELSYGVVNPINLQLSIEGTQQTVEATSGQLKFTFDGAIKGLKCS